MITAAQYDALGPLGREIIDHDRVTQAGREAIAASPWIEISVGAAIRDRRAERQRLSRAAATLCNSGSAGGSPTGPRTASLGRR